MTTFVLVHGAWGGSYGFAAIRQMLCRRGHDVFTPSLTGIGERSHLSGPSVTLSTHINDVVNTIEYEGLTDIVLLGFSYGGVVVTGCLDRVGDRVRHLVYLDALVPANGESLADLLHIDPPTRSDRIDKGADWLIPPVPRKLSTPERTAWSDARRSHQPIGTFIEPVRLGRPLEDWDITLTYIKATADPDEARTSAFWRHADHAASSSRWRYEEIATNHMVPVEKPDVLCEILVSFAEA